MSGESDNKTDVFDPKRGAMGSSPAAPADSTAVMQHGPEVRDVSPADKWLAEHGRDSYLSLIGKTMGCYHIRAELGAGGMGAVYLADQSEPVRRQVALKVIKAGMDSEEVIERFQSERELLALMNHPNIAQVLDAGTTPEGRLYFAMEYVPGVPIHEFCDYRGMDINNRLRLFLQICEGVQHAHQKGIIHRDLKPSNLLVADYQGQFLVKIIDFGIAKSMDRGREHSGSTRIGVPIGTPAYMSPEQAAGDLAAIDTRTDVYSLGVVLYRLITHDLPISSDTIGRVSEFELAKVLREAHILAPSKKVLDIVKDKTLNQSEWKRAMSGDPQSLSRTLRGDLDWIALKALDREREQRYSSVSELAADIRRYTQGEAVLAGPPSQLYRIRKFVNRNKLAVGAALAVVMSLILGILGTSKMAIEARAQRARAESALLEAQAQRDRAAEESARAIATRSFLEDMIAAPDPWKLEGSSAQTRDIRVVDALAEAAANLDKRLADNPQLRAEVSTMLGRTLRRLGQFESSRAQLESAVQLLKPMHAADALPRIEAEIQLAATLTELGDFQAANALLTPLLPRLEQISGLSADSIIDARRSAALAANGMGDGERAETIARENLQLASRVSDSKSATSGAQSALADILGEQGKWEEAERLLTEAYTNEQLRFGRDHPRAIQMLSLVANLAFRKGDYAAAEARYQEAAASAQTALGAEHPETLRFRAHAILAMAERGERAVALQAFREQIPLRAKVIGEDHPDLLTMRSNFANALHASGQLDAAEKEIESVFRRRSAIMGESHPETLAAMNVLGVIVNQRKDYAKAEVLFRQAAALFLQVKGEDHPETIMMQANHLAATRNLGKIDEAIAGLTVLELRAAKVFPAEHRFLAIIRGHLGLSLMEGKQFDAAEKMLKLSFESARANFGDSDPRTQTNRSRLAELYKRFGKPEEAKKYQAN